MNQQTKTTQPNDLPREDIKSSMAETDAFGSPDPASDDATGNSGQDTVDRSADDGSRRASTAIVSNFHALKLDERRYHWVMEWKIVGYTVLVFIGVLALTVASYAYHSRRTPATLLSRADRAAEEGDLDEEVRWLNTYLLMRPDHTDIFVRAAISADKSANAGSPKQLARRVPEAHKRLSNALAFLPDTERNHAVRNDLRRRLIARKLQLGGYYYQDAERQIIALNPPRDDREAHRWMAEAILGQVQELLYQTRRSDRDAESEYWAWLADQPPGEVLFKAIEKNPENLGLTDKLFTMLSSNPEVFGAISIAGSESEDADDRGKERFRRAVAALDEDDREELQGVLDRLQDRGESEARIQLYRYAKLTGKEDQALAVISQAADAAAERLATLVESPAVPAIDKPAQATSEKKPEASVDRASNGIFSEQEREAVWDYQAVLIAANALLNKIGNESGSDIKNDSNWQQSHDWLRLLRDLEIGAVRISPTALKNVYLTAGVLEQRAGNVDAAIEIWKSGLEILTSDNLDLRGSIAMALSGQAGTEQQRQRAEKAVEEFERIVAAKGKELRQMTSAEVSDARRAAMTKEIESARWRARIARTQWLASGKPTADVDRQIIGKLQGVSARDLQLDQSVVETGVKLLSDAYERRLEWDLAAEVLEAASDIFPQEEWLLASANAWTRAGNLGKAQRQWQRARLSNDLRVRLGVLEAEFANQLRLVPKQRDIERLRLLVRRIRAEFAKSSEPLARETLRLQLLEAQLPPPPAGESEQPEVTIEQHLQSVPFAERVSEIAEANQEDASLQVFAAERLAAAGKFDQAQEVAERAKKSGQIDAAEQAMLQARLFAADDRFGEAAQSLLAYLQEHPDAPLLMALQAAEAARLDEDPQLIEACLLAVPEARRSPLVWYQLYKLAATQKNDKAANGYLKQLHEIERYHEPPSVERKPAYSLLIDAQRLADKLFAREEVQWDDPQLRKAERLVQQLQVARPNWGVGIALRGWLEFVSGDMKSAIEYLQRGIHAGDNQSRTRRLLWRALIAEGRVVEAEQFELANSNAQTDFDPYNELKIGDDLRRGRYEDALKKAKQGANEKPEDPIAQLMYAKYALARFEQMVSGKVAAESLEKEELLENAREALERASTAAQKSSVKYAVAWTRLQMLIGLRDLGWEDDKAIRSELERISMSYLSKASRLFLEAKAHTALGEVDPEAIEKVRESNEIEPTSEKQTTLAQLHRSRGQLEKSREVLREAYQRDPANSDLRAELAREMFMSSETLDRDAMSKLLNEGDAVTTKDQLLYALFLASKGDEGERKEAVRVLRSLRGTRPEIAIPASRLQAELLLDLAENGESLADEARELYRDEARQIYDRLASGDSPSPVDVRRYCEFLIQFGKPEDEEQAKELVAKLKSLPNSAIEVLKVEMFLARHDGRGQDLPGVVASWATDLNTTEQSDVKGSVESRAGDALLQAGFIDEGISWFKQAYEANADLFYDYVIALSEARRYRQAAEVSAAEFEKSKSSRAAVLLTEALLADASDELIERYVGIVNRAVSRFPENKALLEGAATLEMQTGNKERAIGLYQKVLTLDPTRLRTLNNLAMALAEVPGRALEGLKPIDQAILLAGKDPELLDTKGTVLLRAGKLEEARDVFESAIEVSDEPRYQFHLIQTLVQMGNEAEAATLWRQLDLKNLDRKGLTLNEQQTLKDYRNRF